MKALLRVGLLLSLCLLVIFGVQAEDDQGNVNDPNQNPRSNACYEGGSMAGQCDTPEEWEAGWYLIRFEFGLISREDFPAYFSWVLPDGGESAGGICYNNGAISLFYNGNSGTQGNFTMYNSTNCTGETLPRSTLSHEKPLIVVGATSTNAGNQCRNAQANPLGIDWLSLYGFNAPHDVYVCVGT